MKLLPYVFLFTGIAVFGSATPVSKLVGGDFPIMAAAGVRVLLAGFVLLPFALAITEGLFRLKRKDWLLVLGVALLGNVGFSAFLLYGMQMVSGVLGSLIMSLTPAVTATGAVLFLGERMTQRKILALAVGVAGVLTMQITSGDEGNGSNIWLGSLLVFAAICCEACYTLMGKAATEDMTPLKLTTLSALLAGAMMLPWIVTGFASLSFGDLTWRDWLGLAWWGVGTMALGSMLWYSGVTRVPGHLAAGFMVVMPVSALLLSYLLLDEAFRWLHVLGFGLAFVGVLLMSWEHYQQAKEEQ
ncbi:MAG TPA: DMT family transporter [Alphaproteobacteria bacterium]|nr:DMT family transporter [Alphaproteobacteria bacterium]